ncbi:MAG TPA: MFS transporter [Xanthobacteraceae bacterium]|nr:MFS transporter [Xanthobacteraceae bacterium]
MTAATFGGRDSSGAAERKTFIRWLIVVILFVVTAVNYADRATISLAGPVISKQLGLNAAQMGFIFSAFGWSYVLAQLPGGWLLDRFGSKLVYALSIFTWSIFTAAQGLVGFLTGGIAVVVLFALRFLLGVAESPSFPGNSRVVAAWFPKQERATAAAIFNSAQYFATVIFAPLMGWIISSFGWPWVFAVMGGLGLVLAGVWVQFVHAPAEHPRANRAEVDYIAAGGGLVTMDVGAQKTGEGSTTWADTWDNIRQLFGSRMFVGIFLGQYCINALTYFFITWFPVYLVQARHMTILQAGLVASIPAICGFAGGVLGGVFSDIMLRMKFSLSVARKTPIVAGMLLSMVMIGCNYTDIQWVVVALMALSFFGKGIGALGWAVMSDTAPKEITGFAGGVFNMCGNLSSISTPIVIGYIIQYSGSFNGALVFVAANALVAAVSYLVIVGEIKRMVLVK